MFLNFFRIPNWSLLLITSFILNESNAQYEQKDGLNRPKSDTFFIDIPLERNGDTAVYYCMIKRLVPMVGLPTIGNGFDSLQIRIYYGMAQNNNLQLVTISRIDSNWIAKLFLLEYQYSEVDNSIEGLELKESDNKIPQSGWQKFVDELLALQILSLPDHTKIDNYEPCYDAYGLTIEFATEKQYRIYNYPCFLSYSEKYWQAKNVESILELLEKELDFDRLTYSK